MSLVLDSPIAPAANIKPKDNSKTMPGHISYILEYGYPIYLRQHFEGGQHLGQAQQQHMYGHVNINTISPTTKGPTNMPYSCLI